MQKFLDSPLAVLLRVLGDLMLLNVLCILCSLPVITLGASFSAMYSVLLKMHRGENVPIIRTFFKSFKENFLPATGIELIFIVLAVVAYADFLFALTFENTIKSVFIVLATVIAVIALTLMTLGIAQISLYKNSFVNYIKNSFLLAACAPGWLILAWIIWLVPIAAVLFFPEYAVKFGFVLMMWALSGPAYGAAYCMNRIFTKVENAQQA